ncbi:DUF6188 family protein [Cellulomonas sp. C5510]|uniref:DUF6188 family protein n=1 Tax=Cellulomonas sp. C5510 TaxID=2871170 RepID=UPI001C959E19|nr:DUF6188 family protein [Cellulomonas sp. C5510]QZN84584.1 DUF6188 family protein [Cellulomonas sp. C5510]
MSGIRRRGDDDGWDFDIAGRATHIAIDCAVVIATSDGYSFRIEQPFRLIDADRHEHVLVPEGDPLNLRPVLALERTNLASARAFDDGRLELDFVDGSMLRVPGDEDHEPGEASGPFGLKVVDLASHRRRPTAVDGHSDGGFVMRARLEVSHLDDVRELGVMVESSEQPGVASSTAWAGDGDAVTLTWDEIAGAASVRWLDGDQEGLVLEREAASKISVRAEGGCVQFRVWSRSQDLGGELVVRVGAGVSVRDALLRL